MLASASRRATTGEPKLDQWVALRTFNIENIRD
jgi:hypothetical protein